MGVRIVRRRSRRETGEGRRFRYLRACEIPLLIAVGGRREHVPYGCFANHWNWWPDDREAMVAEPPVSDSYEDLCRIAAVIHALCHRDAIPVPPWALQYRSRRPLLLSPFLETLISPGDPLWPIPSDKIPPACEYHNVWFDRASITHVKLPLPHTDRESVCRHLSGD